VPRVAGSALIIPTPYVARASGGGVAELRRGPSYLAATLQALGPRPFANAPASRAYELPAVALVGARAGVVVGGPTRRVLVTAGVDNVGAVEWQSVRGYPTPGRSWSLGVTLDP
jgi:outer membrane cobalamin receptor